MWVRREMPSVPFCRYADDGLLHCKTRQQAEFVMKRIGERFRECGLELHSEKTKIVYCKDRNRQGEYPGISLDFLGYTFRPRRCVDSKGNVHPNFLPAISRSSRKRVNQTIRSWHIQLKNDKSLEDLSRMFNPILQGWKAYYGRFYASALNGIWQSFNQYLVRWVRRKYKRLACHERHARGYLNQVARNNPALFVHWQLGIFP